VWRCGRVEVWTCGGVEVWRCGRVDVWTCVDMGINSYFIQTSLLIIIVVQTLHQFTKN